MLFSYLYLSLITMLYVPLNYIFVTKTWLGIMTLYTLSARRNVLHIELLHLYNNLVPF